MSAATPTATLRRRQRHRPTAASSGRTVRHRFDPGGNRQLNRALYTIAITEIRSEDHTPPTVRLIQVHSLDLNAYVRTLKGEQVLTVNWAITAYS